MYSNREQSRKPRVKCRPNGELRDGRRIYSAMRLPHPLLHIGTLPYVATILGRAKGRLFICPFPPVSIFVLLPDQCQGVFCVLIRSGIQNSRLSGYLIWEGFYKKDYIIITHEAIVCLSMLTGLQIQLMELY